MKFASRGVSLKHNPKTVPPSCQNSVWLPPSLPQNCVQTVIAQACLVAMALRPGCVLCVDKVEKTLMDWAPDWMAAMPIFWC